MKNPFLPRTDGGCILVFGSNVRQAANYYGPWHCFLTEPKGKLMEHGADA